MRRREFVAGLMLAITVQHAQAQQPAKIFHVGFGPLLARAAAGAPSPMRRDRFRVAAAGAAVVLSRCSGDRLTPSGHGLVGHLAKLGL